MKIRFSVLSLFATILCVAFSDCASNASPAADTQSVSIKIVQERFMHHVYIVEIDGAKTSNVPLTRLISGPKEVKVSPGRHTFLVESNGAFIWRMKLWLDAEPNITYYLRSENKGRSFKAWFQQSGEPGEVGGSLPID